MVSRGKSSKSSRGSPAIEVICHYYHHPSPKGFIPTTMKMSPLGKIKHLAPKGLIHRVMSPFGKWREDLSPVSPVCGGRESLLWVLQGRLKDSHKTRTGYEKARLAKGYQEDT